ncbi:MAG: amidohydrolase family protein [Bacillota bacterium]
MSIKAIVNGQVFTMAGPVYKPGVVLIEGDKIAAVGAAEAVAIPPSAEIIDAAGAYVFPGFIDAHCHVGIYEEIYQVEGDDVNEMTDPATPHLRALDAINPEDVGFKDCLAGGVTTVVVGPGSGNVIGGEMVALKTWGQVLDEMLIRPVGLKVAFGENPKKVYGAQKRTPSTRMGTAAILRENLVKAANYLAKEEKERDLKLEALARVLKGEMPLRAHAHRADDIATAIRIAREFGVKIVIEHCTEGHKIADWLARQQVAAIVGPVITSRAKVELKDKTPETAKILHNAGVPVALMTDAPVIPANYLNLSAALVAREGLEPMQALAAITSRAAEIVGIADRVGTLEAGKDADMVIWDRFPLELEARPLKIFIEGRVI